VLPQVQGGSCVSPPAAPNDEDDPWSHMPCAQGEHRANIAAAAAAAAGGSALAAPQGGERTGGRQSGHPANLGACCASAPAICCRLPEPTGGRRAAGGQLQRGRSAGGQRYKPFHDPLRSRLMLPSHSTFMPACPEWAWAAWSCSCAMPSRHLCCPRLAEGQRAAPIQASRVPRYRGRANRKATQRFCHG
jgi:hypothetical protein